MNNKERVYLLIETFIQACKFRGLFYAIKWLIHTLIIKFLVGKRRKNYRVFGNTFHYKNKESLIHLMFEMMGGNEYYFISSNDKPLIIDVGANIGDSVIFFKTLYPKAVIHAFEPNEDAYEILEKNVKMNNFNDVATYNTALGNHTGLVELYDDDPEISLRSTISQSYMQNKIASQGSENVKLKVYKVPLKELVEFGFIKSAERIDLLKMDIEGGEKDVIENIVPFLNKINRIVFEYHLVPELGDNSFDTIINILRRNNFNVSISGFFRYPNNMTNSGLFMINAIQANA